MRTKRPIPAETMTVLGVGGIHHGCSYNDAEFQEHANAEGVSLVREPDNAHDPNALKLYLGTDHVGYIRANPDAADVVRLLNLGIRIEAVAARGPTPPDLRRDAWRVVLLLHPAGPARDRVTAYDPWDERPPANAPSPDPEDLDLLEIDL